MAGTLLADTLNTSTGVFSTNNAYTGVAKAWVNFGGGSGSTAGVINKSFNVSSVTVNATGNYTINFVTAFTSTNYASTTGVGSAVVGSGDGIQGAARVYTTNTGSQQILVVNAGGTATSTSLFVTYIAFSA
jgi:hypothetical protein